MIPNAVVPSPLRVITYIDGFNLYYGMRAGGLPHCYWLDVHRLSMHVMGPGTKLAEVKYFTSRVSGPEPTKIRQTAYLDALAVHCGIRAIEGQFLPSTVKCHDCGRSWPDNEEKMTDVNIAPELLTDAFLNRFDLAVIISGDSDLTPPVLAIKKLLPKLKLRATFPPNRESSHLRKAVHNFIRISPGHLEASQLPDEITKPNGYVLRRPATWVKQ